MVLRQKTNKQKKTFLSTVFHWGVQFLGLKNNFLVNKFSGNSFSIVSWLLNILDWFHEVRDFSECAFSDLIIPSFSNTGTEPTATRAHPCMRTHMQYCHIRREWVHGRNKGVSSLTFIHFLTLLKFFWHRFLRCSFSILVWPPNPPPTHF